MRPYNPNDPHDKELVSQAYARAREFVPAFLKTQPDSFATTHDIRDRFRQENPGLCNDAIVRSVNNSQPKWQHCIDSVLSNFKGKGILVQPNRGMWYLASATKSESDASPNDSQNDDENLDMEYQSVVSPNPSYTEDAEEVLNEDIQSELITLKSQIANQQSAIESLNAKIADLSVVSYESITEGDIIKNLRERVLKMEPDEFERLVGEYLKAKGFSNVVVSGRSHDGGIDGECELPLIDVKVAFQAKRYAAGNNIGIDPVQRLNGSLGSSYDRGVFITTSEFTSFARGWVEEEQVKIALIEGDELVRQMVDLELGVRTVPVIKHEVDEGFFADLENG